MKKTKIFNLPLIYLFFTLLLSSTITLAQDSPYQAIRLNGGNPIIESSMFNRSSDGENINGPSLIRVPDWIPSSERADPSAQYYLYFAHHSGDYIRMAWAADIEGPYTLYDNFTSHGDRGVLDNDEDDIFLNNNIRIGENHLASPDVIVDDANQQIIMYFHSGSSYYVNNVEQNDQVTWVSTSPYGLEFYNGIESVQLGSSYFRVFEYDGELYSLDNGAKIYRALDPENPWDTPSGHDFTDGLWEEHPEDNLFQNDITLPSSELRVRHTGVRVVGDILHVFYSRRGEFQERIQLSTIDMSSDWAQWDATYPPIEVLAPNPGWEGGQREMDNSETSAGVNVNQLRDPDVFEDYDGQLYLLYTGNGEDAIGLARLYDTPTTDLTLTAIADGHVKESSSSGNFGSLSTIRTSTGSSSSSKRRIYMKFDLSNVSNMNHAVVRLAVSSTTEGPVSVYETSNNWDENTITESNAPSVGNVITTSYVSNGNTYVDWNISDYVEENLGSEISIVFDIAPSNSDSHLFNSRQTSTPPQLLLSSIPEVVVPQPITNIALNQSTNQSSTAHGGVDERAVDGNTNGLWRNQSVTHTNSGIGEWWEVDLGQASTLEDIVVYNRTDNCCASRLGNFTVSVSNTSGGSPVWSQTVTAAPNPSTTITIPSVTGQFVRITQNLNQPLSLAEVEVFGYSNGKSLQIENTSLFSTYPNPFTDKLNIEVSDYDGQSTITTELINLSGQLISKQIDHQSAIELNNMSSLPKSIYLLRVTYNNGQSEVKKIVKAN